MASGGGVSSLSLNCGDTSPFATQATVTGTASPYAGSLYINAQATNLGDSAIASGQVGLNETYILTGGSGTATLTFLLSTPDFHYGDQGQLGCAFTFDGTSQDCAQSTSIDQGGSELDFTAEYGVPFSVQFVIDRYAETPYAGIDIGGFPITYSLTGPGLMVNTPEPSSIWLLIPGLGGVLLAARSRARSRLTCM